MSKNNKETRTSKRKNKKLKTISKIISIISIVVLGFFLYELFNANIIPTKYLSIIIGILIILKLINILFNFKVKNTKKIILIFIDIIAILLMILEIFGGFKINETINFLNKNLSAKYDTNVYYIVVNKESNYKKLSDVEGKTIYSYKDLDSMKKLEDAVNNKVNVKIKYSDNIIDLLNSVIKDKKQIILVNSGNYDTLTENDTDYEKQTKILKTIKIKTKTKNTASSKKVTEEPFTIYLSGIDTRTGGMPARSLSDVNMFIVINPNTRNILLVNTPRDYYVQLHGTTGLKDKLTHAGGLGGVELSKTTIEDILGYNADYYVRVNFNSVINLVDAIGGITLYSDVNYNFSCWTDRSCTFKPGNNTVNGKCALAFARERHAYSTGDRHRGENQEQVIQKIFEKITSSSSLLSNYSNILNALNGTFESNMATKDITSLVKFQLNDMQGWTIETANLDGTTGSARTYSYPNQDLSVMFPNEESINNAKAKIKEVLESN